MYYLTYMWNKNEIKTTKINLMDTENRLVVVRSRGVYACGGGGMGKGS